jgi:hypothetical protein
MQFGHRSVTLDWVSDSTAIVAPQHGHLSKSQRPWGAYLVAMASISTRTSSLGKPVTRVALAGLFLPKNLA